MSSEHFDREIAQVVAQATPELRPELRDRALAAMARCSAARRPRLRLVAAAAAAIAALVGLGFVPFPAGSAKGALERALAAMRQAHTVHTTMRGRDAAGSEFVWETWVSDDGFYRFDWWKDGSLSYMSLDDNSKQRSHHVSYVDSAAGRVAREYEEVPLYAAEDRYRVMYRAMTKSAVEKWFSNIRNRYDAGGAGKITEWRQRSLWGGARNVIEVEWISRGGFNGMDNAVWLIRGERVRIRAYVDPTTGRLTSWEGDKWERGSWRRYSTQKVEYDVPITAAARTFQPPPGTTLYRDHWWSKRKGKVVATARSADWEVTLHAIDMNRRGDLVLSLRRELRPDAKLHLTNTAPPMRVKATDDAGAAYTQLNGYRCWNRGTVGYWVTTLEREQTDARPKTVTLTIYPYWSGARKAQSVTFPDVPLPPRQNVDDVVKAATEVIHY
jgi:hypothetical protein